MGIDFQSAYADLNPADDDYRFYDQLAHDLGAERVLDLGCGTGALARLLTSRGRTVVGIDPDPAMIEYATAQPGGDRIEWRLGYSDCAESASADLAVMSGHVAQVFREDEEWTRVLADLARALAPSGTLAFESRNPDQRRWEAWTREQTLRVIETPDGPTEFWHETVDVSLPLVSYDTLTRNLRTGVGTQDRDVLAFRSESSLVGGCAAAGFEVVEVFGDWDRTPVTSTSPEIIVIAKRVA